MSVDIYLVDRDECIHDGVRCCFEVITVTCPNCGDGTNIVVTYPDYSVYHHSAGVSCKVFWTVEMEVNRDRFDDRLLVWPGYMRE